MDAAEAQQLSEKVFKTLEVRGRRLCLQQATCRYPSPRIAGGASRTRCQGAHFSVLLLCL